MTNTLRRTLAVGTTFLCLTFSAHAAEFINILTGGTSGVYYPLGVSLSQIYAKAIPDSKTSVQATKASAENLNLLQAGRGEVAFTLGDSLSDAWKGEEEAGFKAPLNKLRTIAALYPNYIHFVAAADSGIKSLADIKGKRISVGAPKSGTELNVRKILKAAGYSYKDFDKVEYLSYAESVELMKNRQLDVTLLSSGLGVSALRDLASSQKIVFLTIPADIVDIKKYFETAMARTKVASECKKDIACYDKYLGMPPDADAKVENSPKAERSAFSLSRLGHDAVPVLKKYVGHKDTAVRSAIMFALTRTATKADADVLKAIAEQIEKDRTRDKQGQALAEEARVHVAIINNRS